VTQAVGVIPARYGSTRFPGKPLAMLKDKPLIQWVWERAGRAKRLSRLLIATDDERIASAARGFGAEAVMTPSDLPSGTDRVWAAVRGESAPLIVNIQGDEPLIDPGTIDRLVAALEQDAEAQIATVRVPMRGPGGYADPNVVKVEADDAGRALYFSRSPIPATKRAGEVPEVWYKHIGIYAYRREALERFVGWPPGSLETTEGLEQLRALERGLLIRVVDGSDAGVGVDTPEDLKKVEARI